MNFLSSTADLFEAFVGHQIMIHSFSGKQNVCGNLVSFDRQSLALHLSSTSAEKSMRETFVIAAKDVKFIEFMENTNIPVSSLLNRAAKKRNYAKKRYSTYYKGKSWFEWNWVVLNWVELNWVELQWNWVELYWIELQLNWVELYWIE